MKTKFRASAGLPRRGWGLRTAVAAVTLSVLFSVVSPRTFGDTPPAPAADPQVLSFGLREDSKAAREYPGWRRPQRILVDARFRDRLASLREVAPGVELVAVSGSDDVARAAAMADAAIGICDPRVLGEPSRVRWIQLLSAGVDRCVRHPQLRERGTLVTAMRRVSSAVLADHVLAMTLALTRGLDIYLREEQRGRWNDELLDPDRHWALDGRTMLVVGLGGIGTEVARRAHGFGMKILATRSSSREGPAFVSYVGLPDELPKLAAQADIVVNCAPLTPATRGMFDARVFAVMKPTAYFVNIGRGASVVTADLVSALEQRRIAGAALDVTDPEPLPPDHPLWRMPGVVITPHVGGFAADSFEKRWRVARENVRRYVAGEKLLEVVDLERGY
jgi:phosphoglycerate dehydrogenase-like enzyme